MARAKTAGIPRHFRTAEAAGRFWDTHDLADHWDQTDPASVAFHLQRQSHITARGSGKLVSVSKDALRFAIANVRNFYDSDFFPTLGDYRAIQSLQADTVDHLSAIDLSKYSPKEPRIAAAPKPGGGFRVVHQLHPLDHIIYTAVAFEFGSDIEAQRPRPEARVACSYRIALDARSGSFFAQESGYSTFIARSAELAATHQWVLVADITDFYNQIYSHRLRGNLSYCNSTKDDLALALEKFLHGINDSGASKGIPVGPPASIVFAEASLLDIDQFISNRGKPHVRYVDDIRIFGNSRRELMALLEQLSLYLYQNHRLSLSSQKTKLLSRNTFVGEYVKSPEADERVRIHDRLEEFADVTDLYAVDLGTRPVGQRHRGEIQRQVLCDLMDDICSKPVLDLGLARHVLRRCRKLRTVLIVDQLLRHFDLFAPVVRDVVLYLDEVASPSYLRRNEALIAEIIGSSETVALDYVRFWVGYFIGLKLPFFTDPLFHRFVFEGPHLDNQAVAALRIRDLSWVRERKVQFDSLGDRERRAVLHASFVMPKDERHHWLDVLTPRDYLEALVIRWVRSHS